MGMKTLVVGHEVGLVSGCYGNRGKVIAITPQGVDVHAEYGGAILHFDNEGKGRPGSSTYECGPWYIEGTQPVEEKVPITRFYPIEEAMLKGMEEQRRAASRQ